MTTYDPSDQIITAMDDVAAGFSAGSSGSLKCFEDAYSQAAFQAPFIVDQQSGAVNHPIDELGAGGDKGELGRGAAELGSQGLGDGLSDNAVHEVEEVTMGGCLNDPHEMRGGGEIGGGGYHDRSHNSSDAEGFIKSLAAGSAAAGPENGPLPLKGNPGGGKIQSEPAFLDVSTKRLYGKKSGGS